MIGTTPHMSLAGSRLTSSVTQPTEKTAASASGKAGATAPSDNAGTTSSVSSLARQLSEVSARAQIRDSGLSHKELGEKAAQQLAQITGSQYFQQQAQHNAQLPVTDDPELLTRAQQATSFVNGTGSNPFKGLSSDQLALIAYDDGDTFTVNERRAAWLESDSQRQAWQQQAVAAGMQEHSQTGKMTGFYTAAFMHYNMQPAIEQARYPENYAERLHAQVSANQPAEQEASAQDTGAIGSAARTIEQLFAFTPHANDMEEHAIAATKAQAAATGQVKAEPAYTNPRSTPGYEVMVSRLFNGKEPPVGNPAEGYYVSRSSYDYLTRSDRILLSEVYSYAQEEGADLSYVDRLAQKLGTYRQRNDGKLLINFNNGNGYDGEGRQLTVSFNEKDTATAARILSGAAMNSTAFDRGFLRHILDPGYGALSHITDFEFLEHMVSKFSNEGADLGPLDSRFSTYEPKYVLKDHYVMTANENVRIEFPEPHIININGVFIVTDRGRAEGITLDNVKYRANEMLSVTINQDFNLSVLQAFFGTQQSFEEANEFLSLIESLYQQK